MDFFQYSVPTKIVYAPGLAADFSAELDLISAQKFFIVTDKVLKDLHLVDPIIEGINQSGREVVGVFSEVPPDSGVKVIEAVAANAKECGAEAFVAIGGGSVMDTAKGANIIFSLGGNLIEDYSGAQTIAEDLSPLVAIPTTAGTGSEVTEAIVILDEATSTKMSFVDSHMLPDLTILDPELTTGLPPKITAATAIDALTHAIESVMSVQHNPVSDALAAKAIALIFQNLETAVNDGDNIDARGALLIASNLAGMAFNHAMVGVVHAVAHTIGGMYHVHHGTANGIFLPYGMEYNFDEVKDQLASIAPAMKVSSAEETISAVKDLLTKMHDACGLEITLKQAGIPQDGLAKIAEAAPDDGASFYNPKEVEASALLPLLEKAYG